MKNAAALMLVLLAMPALADEPDTGRAVFQRCRACHRVGEGALHVVGPELNGIVGRKAGSAAGYAYSEALRASGLIFDSATLDQFLAAPAFMVPGTKMTFAGVKDPDERAALIRWLEQFGPDGRLIEP